MVCGESRGTTIIELCVPATLLYLCSVVQMGIHYYTWQASPGHGLNWFSRSFQKKMLILIRRGSRGRSCSCRSVAPSSRRSCHHPPHLALKLLLAPLPRHRRWPEGDAAAVGRRGRAGCHRYEEGMTAAAGRGSWPNEAGTAMAAVQAAQTCRR
jgi:hypothetical protein